MAWFDYLPLVMAGLALLGGVGEAVDAWRAPVGDAWTDRVARVSWKLALAPMKALFLFVVFSALVGYWRPAAPSKQGGPAIPSRYVITGGEAVGCRSRHTIGRFAEMINAGDKAAFGKLIAARYRDGECQDLAAGAVVIVIERPAFSGLARVRIEGELDEWWLLSKQIEPR